MSQSFSSTQTPEMVKKRKREDAQELATAEPSAKKAKKRKPKQVKDAGNTGDESVLPVSTPTTVDKKPSKKAKVADELSTKSSAPAASEKKKRKPKVQREPAVPATPENAPPRTLNNKTKERAATAEAATPEELLLSHSPFVQLTTSFYLALSPCAHDFPLEGLCAEHISPLLLTYCPSLKGILLSYDNPRLSEHPQDQQTPPASSSREANPVLARSIDEYAVTYVWLTADFLVFKPERGSYLEGYVNLQNESILGLVCYNYFNAGVEFARLPKDWRWVSEDDTFEGKGKQKAGKEGEGYWIDGAGKKVEGRLVFRVRDFEATPGTESGGGSINIYGTLLPATEDIVMDDEERQRGLVGERAP
ncbi:hypothetical protein LTR08_006221 [Meristemomyces frigidus]|nr:hypothetical protein LTR08_006221 [Meristemomyces frigidus]